MTAFINSVEGHRYIYRSVSHINAINHETALAPLTSTLSMYNQIYDQHIYLRIAMYEAIIVISGYILKESLLDLFNSSVNSCRVSYIAIVMILKELNSKALVKTGYLTWALSSR